MRVLPKIAALALSVACVPVVPAMAQTTAYAVGQGSPNQITLSIPVTASVGGRCGFAAGSAPSGTYNQPDFDVIGLNHDFFRARMHRPLAGGGGIDERRAQDRRLRADGLYDACPL